MLELTALDTALGTEVIMLISCTSYGHTLHSLIILSPKCGHYIKTPQESLSTRKNLTMDRFVHGLAIRAQM